MKSKILLFATLFFAINSQSQPHSLYYLLKGYTGQTAVLFGIKGSESLAIDTAYRQSTGAFVFTDIQRYPKGMYSVYFNDSIYTEVILNNENIVLKSEVGDIITKMEVSSSDENRLFFNYWNVAQSLRKQITALAYERDQVEKSTYNSNHPRILEINEEIEAANLEFYKYVEKTKEDHPTLFVSKLLNAYIYPSMEDYNSTHPDSIYSDEESFYFDHYFDNIDFSEPIFINTKVLYVSISEFMETFGQPASTLNYKQIIDNVMDRAKANDDVYQYCLNLFIRTFENSIWEDVMVHLIDKYYVPFSGANPQISAYYAKYSQKVKSLKPGKLAPNIILNDTAGKSINLHNTKGKAKMIIFYSSDCPHCAEALPGLLEVHNAYKSQGLISFGVAIDDEARLWKKEVKKFDMNWYNMSDLKGMASPLITDYNISITPTIIILNKDNIIMSKPKDMTEVHTTLVQLLND